MSMLMGLVEQAEKLEEQVRAQGGRSFRTLPGWKEAATPDADLRWRPTPDPADGSLFQDPDFSYPTAAGPLEWQLFYNSGAGADSEWGYNRRASWPLRLTSDGTTVTVMHDDGVDWQYRNVAGSFVVQNVASGDTLVQNADTTWDETRGDTGYKFHFPAGNYVSLSYRATPQDLRITCSYDSSQRLQSLAEPAGRRWPGPPVESAQRSSRGRDPPLSRTASR